MILPVFVESAVKHQLTN